MLHRGAHSSVGPSIEAVTSQKKGQETPLNPLVSRKEETRRRIVDTAARLFLEKGVDRVGVDEIMRECGLTHGGFYVYFPSKEALISEACIAALDEAADQWEDLAHSVADDRPMAFHATLRNPEPPGEIRTDGQFGPLERNDVGKTQVSGSYVFENANLGVFHGIRGTLASDGNFNGVLEELGVEGNTDVPDFEVPQQA